MTAQMSTTTTDDLGVADWRGLFSQSGDLIAPTFPLDQFIAVNPWWEMRHLPIEEVAARMAALGKVSVLAPEALSDSAQALPFDAPSTQRRIAEHPGHWLNIIDLIDQRRDLAHRMSWHDEVVEQISRFAARYFSASSKVADDPQQLYSAWLDALRHDTGIAVLMDEADIGNQFAHLPEDINTLFTVVGEELKLDTDVARDYAHALLLDVKGWAAWVAYLRWQARLEERSHTLMDGLIAIRVAWELLLWRHVAVADPQLAQQLEYQWRAQQGGLSRMLAQHSERLAHDWACQRAAERSYQDKLAPALLEADLSPRDARPSLQAAFCIDVRSEPFRRQLEAQHPGIQTIGFAGFFGLPIDFRHGGSAVARPQLPGLLKPGLSVTQVGDQQALAQKYQRVTRWSSLGESAPAMFGMVEAAGLSYAWRLLKRGFFPSHAERADDNAELQLGTEEGELAVDAKVDLAATILGAMGLTGQLADTVLLVGHGSSNCNNPHAASLDCGACGGQSGEINVRVLASLLNDKLVRTGLEERGISLPPSTRFIPALHDTTTDEVRSLAGASVPAQVGDWLSNAAVETRRERYHATAESTDDSLAVGAQTRAHDWSEIRPEWGLAGNAAFVAAPRSRTQHLNLESRVFLHDYSWSDDDGSLLELILTAPVVVANWINMQYNASVADNHHYGSGSKTLHNVVGGRLGVIEGQGGDLRIGLPMQSIHDGSRWMHTPLRLSVYIEAPRAAIDVVYDKHQVVRELVDNGWLYLFQIDDEGIWRCASGQWSQAYPAGSPA
jgi:uncharacterized protein YbcC (UPF0753/DUF2309 family)